MAVLPAFCGNARIDAGEECDEGVLNSIVTNALCRPDCTYAECGDGIIDTAMESCDDGNVTNNDGCSASCALERQATPTETLPSQIIDLPFQPQRPTEVMPGQQTEDPIIMSSAGNIIVNVPGSNLPGSVVRPGGTPRPPSNTDSGPAALIVMIAGAAAGYGVMRRKK